MSSKGERHRNLLLHTLVLSVLGSLGAGSASAQETAVLPEAWGQLHFEIPSGRLPMGVPEGVTITLGATDGSYSQRISTSNRALRAQVFSSGKFVFDNVPTGKSMLLVLQFESVGRRDVYRSTYRFHEPKLNPVQRFRKARALELAGYLGDFDLNIQTATITPRDRFGVTVRSSHRGSRAGTVGSGPRGFTETG